MIANVLSIAGSDPSGGAGIQADLKTFSALGCYGMAVITALTAQNTRGVTAVHIPPPAFIAQQIDAIFADVRVDAVKIGMLASGEIAAIVAERLKAHGAKNIVLDPVLVATSGDSLGSPDVVDAMRRHLFPLATVITPNIPEAERLSGFTTAGTQEGLQKVARDLATLDARAVLVKGGHLATASADDVLLEGGQFQTYSAPRVDTQNTHGTGCTLSSAIACYLAKGHPLRDAVGAAKAYLTLALQASDAIDVGGGHGPVHHFHAWWK
jgi:hydroxymethylpyrimidine/phosphomethylpyrimidine kinase